MLIIWNDNWNLQSVERFPRKWSWLWGISGKGPPALLCQWEIDTLLIKGQFTFSVPYVCFHLTVSPSQILNCMLLPLFRKLLSLICGGKVFCWKILFFWSLNIAGHMWHTFLLCRFLQCTLSLWLFFFFPPYALFGSIQKDFVEFEDHSLTTFPGFLFCSSKFPATALKCWEIFLPKFWTK